MLDLKVLNATLDQLEEEKKIPRERIIEAIEQALAAAYKKDFGKKGQIIRAHFNQETGDTEYQQIKVVVDDSTVRPALTEEELLERQENPEIAEAEAKAIEESGEEPLPRFDSAKHIYIADARKIKTGAELNDEIVFPLETNEEFGRIAAQTAKQVIIQRIREAVKGSILGEFEELKGDIVTGMVQKVERGSVLIDLGRAVAILPKEEQIPGEFYKTGQRIKAFLYHVEETPRGVNLKLSRSHPRLIEALFALESPEVASGTVEIKSIAREAGSRSKIAVVSYDENIDPIGACVGQKGIRVATVMSELNGEKIDIIPWSADDLDYVAASLSPASVLDISLNDDEHIAHIEVADDQLSLAIGKGGQNVRLAAKLTGWKIDITGIDSQNNVTAVAQDGKVDTQAVVEDGEKEDAEEIIEEAVEELESEGNSLADALAEVGVLAKDESTELVEKAEELPASNADEADDNKEEK